MKIINTLLTEHGEGLSIRFLSLLTNQQSSTQMLEQEIIQLLHRYPNVFVIRNGGVFFANISDVPLNNHHIH